MLKTCIPNDNYTNIKYNNAHDITHYKQQKNTCKFQCNNKNIIE